MKSSDSIEINPLKHPVTKIIEIPGSKSYTNRALILAVLTKGSVILHNPLFSEDTEAMISCLRILGLRIETNSQSIIVHDDISVIQNREYHLFAKDSGTTLRFLLTLLCLTPGIKTLKGNDRLNERPIQDLITALQQLDANIDFLEEKGRPPLKIKSSSLKLRSEISIDGSLSSQFTSALLMISPLLNGLTLYLKGNPVSISYIDMTIQIMEEWGVSVIKKEHNCFYVPPHQHYQKSNYVIEGDFSSAGYFFSIAALTQSKITIRNLNPKSSQPDFKFLKILEKMGNEIVINNDGITVVGKQILPLSLNMEECPDQVQTLAVLAAFANGITTISGIRSLRYKETERVQAIKNELTKMGIKVFDTYDTLTIFGGSPKPATIDTYGDHRMAMAFAVAGTKLPGMLIRNPEVVKKTFPKFWEILKFL